MAAGANTVAPPLSEVEGAARLRNTGGREKQPAVVTPNCMGMEINVWKSHGFESKFEQELSHSRYLNT